MSSFLEAPVLCLSFGNMRQIIKVKSLAVLVELCRYKKSWDLHPEK